MVNFIGHLFVDVLYDRVLSIARAGPVTLSPSAAAGQQTTRVSSRADGGMLGRDAGFTAAQSGSLTCTLTEI